MFFSTTTQTSTDTTQHEVQRDRVPAACNVSYRSLQCLCSVGPRDRFKYFLEHSYLVHRTENRNHLTGYATEVTDSFFKYLCTKIWQDLLGEAPKQYTKTFLVETGTAFTIPTDISARLLLWWVHSARTSLCLPPKATFLSTEDAPPNFVTQPICLKTGNMNCVYESNGSKLIIQWPSVGNTESFCRSPVIELPFSPRKMFFPL